MNTAATMRPGLAPSAARIPISLVRRETVNDISEWMPDVESSSTINAMNPATAVSVQLIVASPPPALASALMSVSRSVGSTAAASTRSRSPKAAGSLTRTAS